MMSVERHNELKKWAHETRCLGMGHVANIVEECLRHVHVTEEYPHTTHRPEEASASADESADPRH